MPVIIIRGTNGSGKTHLMQSVIQRLTLEGNLSTPFQYAVTKKGPNPSLRGWQWPKRNPPVFLLGKYDVACGGCDGFSWKGAADHMEEAIERFHTAGFTTLLEGLTVSSWGIDRLKRLQQYGLTIIQLTTPLDECIASVEARRAVRAQETGKELKPLDTSNLIKKYDSLQKALVKQPAAGIPVELHDRESAARRVAELIGVRPDA